jgi:hypothetical protein
MGGGWGPDERAMSAQDPDLASVRLPLKTASTIEIYIRAEILKILAL